MRSFLLASLSVVVACSTPAQTGIPDAGPTDGGPACAQIAGLRTYAGNSTCSGGLNVPVFTCVLQDGCNLTLVTDSNVLTGTIAGHEFTVTDPSIGETCTGTANDDGTAAIHCTAQENTLSCSLNAIMGPTPEGFENVCCSLRGSECASGTQCRPTLVVSQGSNGFPLLCHAPNGTKGAGETCTRTGGVGVSQDDCAAGLACTAYGAASGTRICAKVCEASTGCPSAQVCVAINGAVPTGLCSDSCDVFASPDTCGSGRKCSWVNTAIGSGWQNMEGCVQVAASGEVGASCQFASECVSGAGCYFGANDTTYSCHQFCDFAHSCPSGLVCNTGVVPTSAHALLGYCDTPL